MSTIQNVGLNDLNETDSCAYLVWKSMINRCYAPNKHNCYSGVTVCNEWLTYSSFKTWFADNYVNGLELDKDLIDPLAKIYSPKYCIFAPSSINKLTTNMDGKGKYLTGVTYHKSTGKFRARISHNNKRVSLGLYESELSAHVAYIKAKIEIFIYHGTNYGGNLAFVLLSRANSMYLDYKEKLKQLERK